MEERGTELVVAGREEHVVLHAVEAGVAGRQVRVQAGPGRVIVVVVVVVLLDDGQEGVHVVLRRKEALKDNCHRI